MPGTKEIRSKIKSVQNTRKITKAMEMVAASKMKKAQDRMRAARPYSEKIRNVAAHISHANPEYRHPYLVERDTVKRVGLIVITADKGLCGALTHLPLCAPQQAGAAGARGTLRRLAPCAARTGTDAAGRIAPARRTRFLRVSRGGMPGQEPRAYVVRDRHRARGRVH